MRISWRKYKYSGLATLISFFGGAMQGLGLAFTIWGIVPGIDVVMAVTGVICLALGFGADPLAEYVNKRAIERLLRKHLKSRRFAKRRLSSRKQ